jgi:protein tyrosine phosphatase (PTP) superfamily phosphohydrolase (DUF442 family)
MSACRDSSPPVPPQAKDLPPAPPVLTTAPATPPVHHFVALDIKSLPNSYWVTDKIACGAQPDGDAGFAALKQLGMKTLISVDGSAPDVARAHQFGFRYVHLPFGYDGIPQAQAEAIAKALRDLPSPIYIHCHHGKHRSAAGVAVGCVLNGMIPPSEAPQILETWGTGKIYTGLWADARNARPLPKGELDSLHVKFVEVAKIPDLAEAMVHGDFYMDHLKDLGKAGWQPIAEQPDLDPPHEALMLEETYTEIGRMKKVQARPTDFQERIASVAEQSKKLGAILRAAPLDTAAANAAAKEINQTCLECHAKYRD